MKPTIEDNRRKKTQGLVHLGGPRAKASHDVTSGPVGRLASYSLRISLLEQCNLACAYCLPGAVISPTEKSRWLRASDYKMLAPLFRARGVDKVRLTGGEPLLRDDVEGVLRAFKESAPEVDLALTTNGTRLVARAKSLADAGLNRVTIHLDTLKNERMKALMGRGSSDEILEGIRAAKDHFGEVKLNVVVQANENEDELEDFLDLSVSLGVEVRFIELMNTGSAREYVESVFVSGREIVQQLSASRGAVEIERRHPSDPAALFRTNHGASDGITFGVIASDTEPFCGACNRLRLTADGRLRGCLYESGGVPLGAALRADADAQTIGALMDAALDDKRSFHPLVAPRRVPFSMADIGG